VEDRFEDRSTAPSSQYSFSIRSVLIMTTSEPDLSSNPNPGRDHTAPKDDIFTNVEKKKELEIEAEFGNFSYSHGHFEKSTTLGIGRLQFGKDLSSHGQFGKLKVTSFLCN